MSECDQRGSALRDLNRVARRVLANRGGAVRVWTTLVFSVCAIPLLSACDDWGLHWWHGADDISTEGFHACPRPPDMFQMQGFNGQEKEIRYYRHQAFNNDFFAQLERDCDEILALDRAKLGAAVARCCRMKAAIVAEDEREAGRRALLNLGHTFGHALEAETGFGGDLLHGEAVAVGMVLAAELSARLGRLDPAAARLLRDHLDHAGLPVSMTEIPGAPFPAARLIAHMAHDKKAEAGRLTFILLDALGRAAVERDVPLATVEAVLRADGAA